MSAPDRDPPSEKFFASLTGFKKFFSLGGSLAILSYYFLAKKNTKYKKFLRCKEYV